MSMLIRVMMAFTLGLVTFCSIPLAAVAVNGRKDAEPVIQQYIDMAMAILGRSLLLKRKHGGYSFKRSDFDATIPSEQVSIGGEDRDFLDPNGYMSTFRGQRFGIAHEARNIIATPRLADLGREKARLEREGDWETTANGDVYKRAFFKLDSDEERLVDIDDLLKVIQGSATPALGQRTETYIEKSQSVFDSATPMDVMIWLMSLGVSFGLMYLGYKLRDPSAGGGGSVLPMTILLFGGIR